MPQAPVDKDVPSDQNLAEQVDTLLAEIDQTAERIEKRMAKAPATGPVVDVGRSAASIAPPAAEEPAPPASESHAPPMVDAHGAEVEQLVAAATAAAAPTEAHPGATPGVSAPSAPAPSEPEVKDVKELDAHLAAKVDEAGDTVAGDFLAPEQVTQVPPAPVAVAEPPATPPEPQSAAHEPAPAPAPGPVSAPAPVSVGAAKDPPSAPAAPTPVPAPEEKGQSRASIGALALRVATAANAPFLKLPPVWRQTMGWVALWTVFLGVCVLVYSAVRPPHGAHASAPAAEHKAPEHAPEPAPKAAPKKKPEASRKNAKDGHADKGGGH